MDLSSSPITHTLRPLCRSVLPHFCPSSVCLFVHHLIYGSFIFTFHPHMKVLVTVNIATLLSFFFCLFVHHLIYGSFIFTFHLHMKVLVPVNIATLLSFFFCLFVHHAFFIIFNFHLSPTHEGPCAGQYCHNSFLLLLCLFTMHFSSSSFTFVFHRSP